MYHLYSVCVHTDTQGYTDTRIHLRIQTLLLYLMYTSIRVWIDYIRQQIYSSTNIHPKKKEQNSGFFITIPEIRDGAETRPHILHTHQRSTYSKHLPLEQTTTKPNENHTRKKYIYLHDFPLSHQLSFAMTTPRSIRPCCTSRNRQMELAPSPPITLPLTRSRYSITSA